MRCLVEAAGSVPFKVLRAVNTNPQGTVVDPEDTLIITTTYGNLQAVEWKGVFKNSSASLHRYPALCVSNRFNNLDQSLRLLDIMQPAAAFRLSLASLIVLAQYAATAGAYSLSR